MVGDAVNVTDVPLHMLPVEPEAMVTAGVTEPLTLMVTAFDVAVDDEAQAALDVITHETTSPLANVEEENVALLLPVLTPLTFH